jgi:hypothetical protein
VSRIRGTRRKPEDTEGDEEAAVRVQEDTGGHEGKRTDTSLRRFGTVRAPGSNPGPPTKNRIQIEVFACSV